MKSRLYAKLSLLCDLPTRGYVFSIVLKAVKKEEKLKN